MRLIKILGIVVAVLIVFWAVSALLHLLYLVAVGAVIAAAIFLAFKGWERYKNAQQRHDERRQERTRQRAERRAGSDIDLRPSIEPRQPQVGRIPAASAYDVDEELARLKRDLP
jgi:hypothetical protein